MSDSRVTLPIETFALIIRMELPRLASESDESLIAICAAENPQCRLTREGGYVTLENLSSIFSPELAQVEDDPIPQPEPVGFFPKSLPEQKTVDGGHPDHESHQNEGSESTLENLLAIVSPEAHSPAEEATLPSPPVDSIPEPQPEPNIATGRDPDFESEHIESSERALENLLAFVAPEADRLPEQAAPPSQPPDSIPEPLPEPKTVNGRHPDHESHHNESSESALGNLLAFVSPEADRLPERLATPPQPPDSIPEPLPEPEIAVGRLPDHESHRNESTESAQGNLLPIIAPEADRPAEKPAPPSQPPDSLATPAVAPVHLADDEIRTRDESDDDARFARKQTWRPAPGFIAVVAIVLALFAFVMYSFRQAYVDIASNAPAPDATSASNSQAGKQASPGPAQVQNMQSLLASHRESGTWIDPATGLMWTLRDNRSDVNWQQATTYCHNLRQGRHVNWRLPTVDELQAIYDTKVNVSGYCCGGTEVTMQVKGNLSLSGWQWSSAEKPPYGTPFSFYNGGRYTNLLSTSDGGRALCVRELGQLIAQPTSNAEE